MNLTWIDWGIVAAVFAFIVAVVILSKPLMRSVADFLAAGRTGGRYLISLSQGTAALGAITIVGMLEMNYIAGFSMRWWEMIMAVVVVGISVSGWVLYRFRQTRCPDHGPVLRDPLQPVASASSPGPWPSSRASSTSASSRP